MPQPIKQNFVFRYVTAKSEFKFKPMNDLKNCLTAHQSGNVTVGLCSNDPSATSTMFTLKQLRKRFMPKCP